MIALHSRCRRLLRPLPLGITFAALSIWLTAPATFAQQYSSSNEFHQAVDTLVQDQGPNQGPNQGGYSRQGYSYHHENSPIQHIAIEVGGGLNRPLGNTRSFATWGGNFTVGGGWNFNKEFAVLGEWQFLSNKIPGNYLADVGVPGGHIHTWGLTVEPTYYINGSGSLGGYIFGGGGFYHRVTTFTVPSTQQVCYYFCYYEKVNIPVAEYSSNQGGANFGAGVTWKAFGPDSSTKVFAEARYVWVNSPKTNIFGTPDGTESFFPITVGLRW